MTEKRGAVILEYDLVEYTKSYDLLMNEVYHSNARSKIALMDLQSMRDGIEEATLCIDTSISRVAELVKERRENTGVVSTVCSFCSRLLYLFNVCCFFAHVGLKSNQQLESAVGTCSSGDISLAFNGLRVSLLNSCSFIASTADSSLFIYHQHNVIAYLLLYVDDIVLTSNSTPFLDGLILQLRKVFDIKDLGPLHYFLGLQVSRTTDALHVTQTKYASDLLVKHQMVDSKPAKTPCSPNTRLSIHEGDLLSDPHGYRSLVGALHYLTFTRPDISFAVHQVCQYMAAPTTTHLSAAKRILRYIKGTLFHGIAFTPGPLTLSVYSDADWAGDPDDRRSTSGLLVYLGSNPITWSAKKQATVSRSSTESEYRALASAAAKVCWLRTLLKDLGIYLSQPPILWCDNVSALAIASNPVFHARTKHIEVDFHFIRERVLRKDLVVKFVSTIDQLANIFTKSLPTQRFLDLQRNLTVSVRPHSIEGG
uniref:Reverse transcriptase Ty1/copia-type domain-containing protein n=1 Tax=Fagus sylvatica TaxID=28930 RepID=A0A2N9GZA0_FAGSY